jgi:2,3-bisphosphoglycerate-independent phosphoglycerate mutase
VKFIVLIGDGMADYPLKELDGKTPLQVAETPSMDLMASGGRIARVLTIPSELPPGSDVANMSIMGYDPGKYYSGRAVFEAASMGVSLKPTDVAFRCNLVTLESPGEDAIMKDYSADHITSEEAKEIIDSLEDALGGEEFHFYPGVSYRHLVVWEGGTAAVETTPPHDISGEVVESFLPKGAGAEKLKALQKASQRILADHPINQERVSDAKQPATSIWLWGQGHALTIPSLKDRYGLDGAVISAVDLVKGLGILAGLQVINVPGATGYLDTNFPGKADYALEALKGLDFVFLHVEAPDEAAHRGKLNEKIKAIEDFDSLVVKRILEGCKEFDDYRILVLPDHATPLEVRTHVSVPVPFAIYGSEDEAKPPKDGVGFNEAHAEESPLYVEPGFTLMDYFIQGVKAP